VQVGLDVNVSQVWNTRPPTSNLKILASIGLGLRWTTISVKSSAKSDARRIRIVDADGFLRVNNIVKRAAEQADGGNMVVTAPSTLVGCCPAPSPDEREAVGREPRW
jgi:hypothetical protein